MIVSSLITLMLLLVIVIECATARPAVAPYNETSKPVIFPKADALIARMESARHYRVAIDK